MITPLELEKNEFKKTLGGYSRKSVDSFFVKVNEDYEKLYKEEVEKNKLLTIQVNDLVAINEGLTKKIEKAIKDLS
jgi:cell division initiation protein